MAFRSLAQGMDFSIYSYETRAEKKNVEVEFRFGSL